MVAVGIASLLEMMMVVEDKNVNFDQTRVDICLTVTVFHYHHLRKGLLLSTSRINPSSEKGHQVSPCFSSVIRSTLR